MKKYSYFGKRVLSMTIAMAMCASMLQVSAGALDDVGVDITSSESNEQDSITDTGVPVEVEENEPQKNTDGSITNSWTASGTDENGVEIKIDGSETIKETPAETDEDGNVTDPAKTETTESIKTTLTDEGQLDLDNAVTVPGKDPTLEGDGPENLEPEGAKIKVDLEASATIRPGETSASGISGDIQNVEDEILGIIQNDSGLNDCQKDENIQFEKQPSKDDGSTDYVRKYTDENGNSVTITITIAADGKSYTKTIRTEEKPVEGKFQEISRGEETPSENKVVTTATSNNTEDPLPEVPTEVEEPEPPTVGTEVDRGEYKETVSKVERDEETGDYTITYTYELPVLDTEGNPVLNEDGTPKTETATRIETLSYDRTESTTEQIVTEKREDTVKITEVTVKKDVTVGNEDGSGKELKVGLSMGNVDYQFAQNVDDEGHGTIYVKDKEGQWTKEQGVGIPENGEEDQNGQLSALSQLEQKFNLITINDITNATVTVKQEYANDTNFKADVKVDLSAVKSKLDGNRLILKVKQEGKEDQIIRLYNEEDGKLSVQTDDKGNPYVKFENIDATDFQLELVGHQQTKHPGDQSAAYVAIHMSSKIKVDVKGVTAQISGTTETKTGERVDTVTAERTETKTVIDSSVTSVLEDFKNPTIQKPDEGGDTGNEGGDTGNEGGDTGDEGGDEGGDTGDEGGDTGDEGGDEGGDTGDEGGDTGDEGGDTGDEGGDTGDEGGDTGDDTGDTTPTTTLPDAEVPLAETPTIDLPDAEVPLADAANNLTDDTVALSDDVAVDIADDIVPLADAPEELTEITGVAVPLADVPQTGDVSSMWFVTLLLSGLALLGLRKKEEI